MKKSFMNNIKNFVDSNVRHRIDRATNNNNDFFGDDLLLVERQFEEIRQVCSEAEKRISALLLSTQSQPAIAGYTQNVQASLNNLSSNLTSASSSSNQAPPAGLAQPSSETLPSFSSRLQQSKANTIESSASNTTTTTTTITSSSSPLLYNQPPPPPATPTPTANSSNNNNDATNNDNIRRHKKLPIVGFLKFLVKSCYKLKPDSLLATTLTHCSQLQAQLTKLYLSYEQTIEIECLRPIQHMLEFDAPNVIKLRKLFIKSHNDLESAKAKFIGASQKQQQTQTSHHFTSTSYTIQQTSVHQANVNKLDQLKKELDEAMSRFEQARDNYATELYTFVCRETELVNLFIKFYHHQAEYQQQVGQVISSSLPSLSNTLALTPRKVVFGTQLSEHLRCTGRSVSLVIELSVHLLYLKALNEEGLFRIPGSSVKIKKLKSAINAWFVTLASQNELAATANEQQQQRVQCDTGGQVKISGGQSALLAIHQLFKDIAGQRQPSKQTNTTATTLFGSGGGNSLVEQLGEQQQLTSKPTLRDDSTLTHQTSAAGGAAATTSLANQQDNQQFVFDVHTIAGLLKLYLRELPEPLFTYALYQQWIDASVKTMNNKHQLGALEEVIKQLPKENYDNLRHLIRFLHLLTCHCDSNKMTSTNLAITMAPSLIWSGQDQTSSGATAAATPIKMDQTTTTSTTTTTAAAANSNVGGDVQALNIQMSSIGISASLHAFVIENLINHSEQLFPGPINFAIPDLEGGGGGGASPATKQRTKHHHHNHQTQPTGCSSNNRCAKSNSPTGLSTASSSSFSSSSTNASVTSSSNTSKTHSRRSGSMEGLTGVTDNAKLTGFILSESKGAGHHNSNRPMSVHIPQQRQQQQQLQQVAPPVPPAPAIRSHSRQQPTTTAPASKDMGPQQAPNRAQSTSSPAPPLPPPAIHKRQLNKTAPQTLNTISGESSGVRSAAPIAPPKPPQPTSCRGSGRIDAAPSPTTSLSSAVARPCVPPPSRPRTDISGSLSSNENVSNQDGAAPKMQPKRVASGQKLSVLDSDNNNDNKSFHSMASSGNLRADFEEINAQDVDDIDISVPSVSPIVSLDSITGDEDDDDDDSSFDNDCRSLDQSWTDMSSEPSQAPPSHHQHQQQDTSNATQPSPSPGAGGGGGGGGGGDDDDEQQQQSASTAHSIKPAIRSIDRQKAAMKDGTLIKEENPSPIGQPPVKPPRCVSPKITQSTPL